MKRKTLMTVLAIVGAVVAILADLFGWAIGSKVILYTVVALLLYSTLEGRLDIQRVKLQSDKLKDPKFWLAFLTALVPIMDKIFDLGLPVKEIIALLALIMGAFFGVDAMKAKKEANEYVRKITKEAIEQ